MHADGGMPEQMEEWLRKWRRDCASEGMAEKVVGMVARFGEGLRKWWRGYINFPDSSHRSSSLQAIPLLIIILSLQLMVPLL